MGPGFARLLLVLLLISLTSVAQVQVAEVHAPAATLVEPELPPVESQAFSVAALPIFPINPAPPTEASEYVQLQPGVHGFSETSLTAAAPVASIAPAKITPQGFQWKPALWQSFTFLLIQQGGLVGSDKWTRHFMTTGKFFPDWGRSVKGAFTSGWHDGDPFLDNYIGHPVQGALTGYIQVQNDPRYRHVEFGKAREYWISRLRAIAWTTAYSFQFEIGPISEASISNLGSYQYMGDHGRLTTGMGYVDFVMTPVGGMGWMMMEDALDRFVVKKLERRMGRKWGNFFRAALNPTRAGANILRAKAPWYRDSRDADRPR